MYTLWIFFSFSAHPWVREGGLASEIPLDISVLSNMRQFVKFGRFKQFALRVNKLFIVTLEFVKNLLFIFYITFHIQALASTLNSEEVADLRDQFDAIDVDKNGAISLEEMRQVSFLWRMIHAFLSFWRRIGKMPTFSYIFFFLDYILYPSFYFINANAMFQGKMMWMSYDILLISNLILYSLSLC